MRECYLWRQCGFHTIFVPQADAAEAALIPDVKVIPIASLATLFDHLSDEGPILDQPNIGPEELAVMLETNFDKIAG